MLDTSPEATGQTAAEKKDTFKVILTVDGVDHNRNVEFKLLQIWQL
jgi:hypothetical protein